MPKWCTVYCKSCLNTLMTYPYTSCMCILIWTMIYSTTCCRMKLVNTGVSALLDTQEISVIWTLMNVLQIHAKTMPLARYIKLLDVCMCVCVCACVCVWWSLKHHSVCLFFSHQDRVNMFQCVCPHGYFGDRCEANIDFCSTNPCVNGSCHVC